MICIFIYLYAFELYVVSFCFPYSRFTGFPQTLTPCYTVFNENEITVHFRKKVKIQVATTSFELGSDLDHLMKCKNLTKYHDKIEATVFSTPLSIFLKSTRVVFNDPNLPKEIVTDLLSVLGINDTCIAAVYDFSCPQECICSLQYNGILVSCSHSKYMILLLHPQNIQLLLFTYHARSIKSFAFSTLPDLIYLGLEFVTLDNNQVTLLTPYAFAGLNNLRLLTLSHNRIAQLPANVFAGLNEMHILTLSHNRIVQLPANVFAGLNEMLALDLSHNRIAKLPANVFAKLNEMQILILSHNRIAQLPANVFAGLIEILALDLSYNQIVQLPADIFAGLSKLLFLLLSYNQITELPVDLFIPLCSLNSLILNNNNLTSLPVNLFTNTKAKSEQKAAITDKSLPCSNQSDALPKLMRLALQNNNLGQLSTGLLKLPSLQIMDLSHNQIDAIGPYAFKGCPELQLVDLSNNTLHWITMKSFEGISSSGHVHMSNFDSCCFISYANCTFIHPRSPFVTCERLLINTGLMTALWILGIICISSNVGVLYYRWKERKGRKQKERKQKIAVQSLAAQQASLVQFLLISNLAASDLIMGIYMLILASTDAYYMEYFPSHSNAWRQSGMCITAGALAILSSEGSVFLITLISVDRFLGIMFPLSDRRLRPKSARIAISAMWFVALCITLVSVTLSLKNTHVYAIPEVCIGLPIARYVNYEQQSSSTRIYTRISYFDINYAFAQETGSSPSMYFSIALFTGLNLLCFLIVTFCYTAIFIEAKRSASSANLTRTWQEELQMAIKMGAVVITDLLCWMPVIILSILVQSKVVTISPVAYVWIATFVLPINSALNPFLYTLAAAISERYKQRKKRADGNIPMRVIA